MIRETRFQSTTLALVTGALLVLIATQIHAATGRAVHGTPERVTWRGMPIEVVLSPGEERSIRVKGARTLRAGLIGGPVPGLRVQPLGDRVFVTASESFRSTRMLLRTDLGDTLMLDLRLDAEASPPPPMEITQPGRKEGRAGDRPVAVTAPQASSPPDADEEPPVGYQRLVRHAARSLYAPRRLAPSDPAIVRIPLRGAVPTEALIRGGCCTARPVAAWRAQGRHGPLWLTAVTVRNGLPRPVEIDPRISIRGRWLAVSAQFWRMGPADTDTASTTLYLISDRPWRQAAGTIVTASPASPDVASEGAAAP